MMCSASSEIWRRRGRDRDEREIERVVSVDEMPVAVGVVCHNVSARGEEDRDGKPYEKNVA